MSSLSPSKSSSQERMTRQEMASLLRALAAEGTDLRNGYVPDTMDLSTGARCDEAPVSPKAPEAWAQLCTGITCISVWPDGEPGACVRYDEPGRMHPLHDAPLIFAPGALESMEYDQIGQLREKCDRVIVVMDK